MLLLNGKPTDRESIRHFQADQLGRFHGNTLLCELMPIPKPAIGTWGYHELIPQYKSRQEYYRSVKPKRIALFQSLFSEHNPKVVICYGKAYWEDYRSIFSNMQFSKKEIFEVANNQSSSIILTPHFTSRTMIGNFEKVVEISGPSKFIVANMYKMLKNLCAKSPLHNKFPLDDEAALRESRELDILKEESRKKLNL